MEKEYEKKIYVKAFQFDGDAIGFGNNEDVPLWAKEAHKNDIIKMRNSETLYIDHREHTDFIKNGDYIIKNEFGYIFALKKSDFEKVYATKDGWIPCSERFPNKDEYLKDDGRFIVTDGNRRYQSCYDIYDGNFKSVRHISGNTCDFSTDKCVIAWQLLPEPYIGE